MPSFPSSVLSAVLISLSLPALTYAEYAALGPVADLHIVNAPVSPDGFSRMGVLADGTFPGPLIKANKGEAFNINVIDELTDPTMKKSTSIHWHGLFQRGLNWADGVTSVTQCPITSGNSFVYSFSPPDQAGTFWYHSHLSTQYCDGLRGPMVIYDPEDPFANLYDVDDESTIITLADWYHLPSAQVPRPATSDSTLINGLGRYPAGPASPLSVITVQWGKRYRFRLINMACDPNYVFSIDSHNFTVIEADGVNHDPIHVDSIQIFAGQRYSFILTADASIDNYWIRAAPNQPNQPKLVGFAGGINSAILRYEGAPDEEPVTVQTVSENPLNEVDLHPLTNPAAPGKPYPGGADKVIPLNLGFDYADGRFLINNASFLPPTMPVLLQILSGAQTAQDLLPKGSVYSLPRNSVIEIVIPPGSAPGAPHPFHLHGHTFSVVRSAGSSTYNYENPARRDVVNIGVEPTDSVTIRFETDNPGPWFLHCHIDWHLDAGLAVVMAEDTEDVKSVDAPPDSWYSLCPDYNALAPGDQ